MQEHSSQKRKYDGEPYYTHLFDVAAHADLYMPLGFECGLCHDLLEDTDIKSAGLLKMHLKDLGYNDEESKYIADRTFDVTDLYTKESFPELNREARKQLEAKRLWDIFPDSQTLKYCDMIDNTISIKDRDPDFWKTYREEKLLTLQGMDKGNQFLYKYCLKICE